MALFLKITECLHRDIFYNDGEVFKTSPCQTCTCRQGSVACFRQECPAVTCENPVTPRGQCCPACDLGTPLFHLVLN
ncbi:unnamed protein product [Lymnaea stagnalis]|uniref:VWFC domain-containing protein n=1 Tax=Lymnaea stagnalis TaxID=6523 RepID=A0AAV2IMT5_LYMST